MCMYFVDITHFFKIQFKFDKSPLSRIDTMYCKRYVQKVTLTMTMYFLSVRLRNRFLPTNISLKGANNPEL